MKQYYIEKSREELIGELESLKTTLNQLKNLESRKREIESELIDNKKKYEILYEDSPSMYFTVDPEGTILNLNKFATQMLGYTKDELIGTSVFKIFHDEDKDVVRNQLKLCLTNPGKYYEWVLKKVKKNKDIIWVKELARSITSASSKSFVLIDCKDVSSQILTEKKLRSTIEKLTTKTKYEELINSISQIIHQSYNLIEVFENTADAITKHLENVDNVLIYVIENNESVLKAHRRIPNWYIEKAGRIPKGRGFTWRTIDSRRLNYCPDTDKENVIGPAGILLGIKSYVSIPIIINDNPIGTINVTSFKKNTFHKDDISLFNLIATQVSMVVKNAIQTEQLQNTYNLLEEKIKERTLELLKSNALLREEIEKRIRAEQEITKSLREKEILLKELQHRVKNNLQVISSMLDLQIDYINNEKISEKFIEAQKRVKSMSLVHEQMYKSDVLSDLDFNQYIENLTNYLFKIYGINANRISMNIEINEGAISFNIAILLGLIINELVSNSLKHAFNNTSMGSINITLSSKGEHNILTVSDNGIGLPKSFKLRNSKSLGLQLVLALTKQLKGNIKLYRKKGTTVKIKFPH